MPVNFVYPGKFGGGLESTLGLYECAKNAGIDSRLYLSSGNVRLGTIRKYYPEARLLNFLSPSDVNTARKEIGKDRAFFTMISPKMFPLFYALGPKKDFYFHANMDHSFSVGNDNPANELIMDIFHNMAVHGSRRVFATQYLMLWQIKSKYGIDGSFLPHPPYSALKEGFFSGEEKVDLPFKDYFLCFGGIDRPYKGTEVLIKAVQGTGLNTVFAGKYPHPIAGKNIVHLNRWLGDPQMHYLVKNAKCIVAPYLVSSQFSGCLALAYYFNRPVLAPRCQIFEDWVDEGKTGWLFSQGNWLDLREKMESIASGKASWDKKSIALKQAEMSERTSSFMKTYFGND